MGPNPGESETDYLQRRIAEVAAKNEAVHGKVIPDEEQKAAEAGVETDAQQRTAVGGAAKSGGK